MQMNSSLRQSRSRLRALRPFWTSDASLFPAQAQTSTGLQAARHSDFGEW
ncbi:hypothetical protein ACPOL_5218 [Acidisarcina polymorpha]|uniref:Uncharacterized protein n=1 Tax=Acidisarcina polymorpha TaxID=2211140 RepID=A0A2Z5G5J2_9BACT|nr:hypothetical protein ACPOL_5218 [Acidisarcina polymorpha]